MPRAVLEGGGIKACVEFYDFFSVSEKRYHCLSGTCGICCHSLLIFVELVTELYISFFFW